MAGWGGLVLGLALIALYLLRPDPFAAVTLLPPLWWGLAGLLWTLAFRRMGGWLARANVLAWATLLLFIAEEPAALVQPGARITGANRALATSIRVVSLNCGMGNDAALREALNLSPDVALLQESPGEDEVRKAARENGYFALHGPDASILSKSKLSAIPLPRGTGNYTAAFADLPRVGRTLIVSLRL